MFGKKELSLLSLAYNSGADGKYLVSLANLNEKIAVEDCKPILSSLKEKNCIDYLFTDRHGEPFVYVKVTENGKSQIMGKKQKRREMGIRIILACLSALITFVVGKLLYLLFN